MIYFYASQDELLAESDINDWVKKRINGHEVTVTVTIDCHNYEFQKWVDKDDLMEDLEYEGIVEEIIDENFACYVTNDLDNVIDTLDSFSNFEVWCCVDEEGIKDMCLCIDKGMNYIEEGAPCLDRLIEFVEYAFKNEFIEKNLFEIIIGNLNLRKVKE